MKRTTETPIEATTTTTTTWLGRYEILGHLADGGMAEIVLGRIVGPSGFQRPVVIKRILPHLARQQDFVEMFLDEARIVAGIRHPNVVQVHELGNDDGFLYLVMEYLEGESLAGLMRRLRAHGETLDYTVAAYIIAEACGGLHAAHELVDPSGNKQNVVHRDVSPQNIFITYDGQVKVLDFGIAVAADRVSRTEVGTFKGKFEFASPEQCRGQVLDRRSDIWALGVVLYEVSTGTRLFKRAGQLDTLRAICDHPVSPPTQDIPGYPEALSKIVLHALERKRAARYETALEMRRELLAVIRSKSGDATTAEPEEVLASLMGRLFADRVHDKAEMLRRVTSGSEITHIPAIDTDVTIEIPIAHSNFPSAQPSTSSDDDASKVVIPRASRTGSEPLTTLGGTVDVAQKRPARALFIGAPIVLLVSLAAIAFVTLQQRPPTNDSMTHPSSSTPTPPVVAAAAAPTSATEIVLHVETEPANAHIIIAGEDRGVSPLDVKVLRGSEVVVIEVKRDGFRVVHERIVPEVDQRLHVTLVATPNVAATPATTRGGPAVGIATKPATTTATSATKGSKYQRFE